MTYVITCTAPDGSPLYWVQEGITTSVSDMAARFDLPMTAGFVAIRARDADGRNWQAVRLDPRQYDYLPMVISALIEGLVVAVIIGFVVRVIG